MKRRFEIAAFALDERGNMRQWSLADVFNPKDALNTAKNLHKLAQSQRLDGTILIRATEGWVARYDYGDCPKGWLP